MKKKNKNIIIIFLSIVIFSVIFIILYKQYQEYQEYKEPTVTNDQGYTEQKTNSFNDDPEFDFSVSKETKKLAKQNDIKNKRLIKVIDSTNQYTDVYLNKVMTEILTGTDKTTGEDIDEFEKTKSLSFCISTKNKTIEARNDLDPENKNVDFEKEFNISTDYNTPYDLIDAIIKSYQLNIDIEDIMEKGKNKDFNSFFYDLNEEQVKKIYPNLQYDKYSDGRIKVEFVKDTVDKKWYLTQMALYTYYEKDGLQYNLNEVIFVGVGNNLVLSEISNGCACAPDSSCNNECDENPDTDKSDCK